MEFTPEFYDAQPLSPWVDDVNKLTSAEARIERAYHNFLVGLSQPAPSALMLAFVAVLAIPPVNARIGK